MSERLKTNPYFEAARAIDAPLAKRLQYFAETLRIQNPAIASAYDRLIARLKQADAGSTAPRVGEALPPFVLPTDLGRLIALDELLAGGPLIVSLNRGHWCSFCQLELIALNEIYQTVRDSGANIIGIIPETAPYASRIRDTFGLRFSILSDLDNSYALELGLAIPLSVEIKNLFNSSGIDLQPSQRNDAWLVPIPATFVLDRCGMIREAFVDPDFRRRIDPARIMAALSQIAASAAR